MLKHELSLSLESVLLGFPFWMMYNPSSIESDGVNALEWVVLVSRVSITRRRTTLQASTLLHKCLGLSHLLTLVDISRIIIPNGVESLKHSSLYHKCLRLSHLLT